MKYLYLIIIALFLFSCNNYNSLSEAQENEFKEATQFYQSLYMDVEQNGDDIMNTMNKNIVMPELR